MITRLVAGRTRTRIIDCVSTWSAENLESSSEPSSKTVKAPGCTRGLGDGDGDGAFGDGVGDATVTTCPVASQASLAAGRKYAKLPAIADRPIAKMARAAVRVGLRRLREALARRPVFFSSVRGQHCTTIFPTRRSSD